VRRSSRQGDDEGLARALYVGAVAAATGGLVSSWFVLTADGGTVAVAGGAVGIPYAGTPDDELLRLLGASLVVLAAPWFATLAASRLGRERAEVRP
jgi:hypothetical protein